MQSDERPEFQRLQYAWTGWLREPERQPLPEGMEPRRLQIYRELFFNNVSGFVENGFPVLQRLLPAELWERLVEQFFARHRCGTPYFHEIAQEFLTFLQALDWPELASFPWLLELAHYEWVELAADTAEQDAADQHADAAGDLLAGTPQVSSLAWPLLYHWPVQRFAESGVPKQQPDTVTCLLVYRDGDDVVRRQELSPLAAHLLETLKGNAAQSGRDVLLTLATQSGFADTAQFVEAGRHMLEEWRQTGVILGTKISTSV